MKSFPTILLLHTLDATLEYMEQLPDLDPQSPGLLDFKDALSAEINKLQAEDGQSSSKEEKHAA